MDLNAVMLTFQLGSRNRYGGSAFQTNFFTNSSTATVYTITSLNP